MLYEACTPIANKTLPEWKMEESRKKIAMKEGLLMTKTRLHTVKMEKPTINKEKKRGPLRP